MIIVEGPDGAGKTTLIQGLCERYELTVAPRVVSKDTEAMTDLTSWVNQNLARGRQWQVFDRHRLISEPIYGPILREEVQPGFDLLNWVLPSLEQFYSTGSLVIYCLPPLKVVRENVAKGDDNRVVRDHIDRIYSAYLAKAGADVTRPNHDDFTAVIWDYTRDGQEVDPLATFDVLIAHMYAYTHRAELIWDALATKAPEVIRPHVRTIARRFR